MDRPGDPDLAARLFAGPEHALTLMRAAWPAAVGPELARRTEVIGLEAGVLRVRVPDPTWQRNLGRMRGQILRRLREVAGRAAPRTLAFSEGAVAVAAVVRPPAVEPAPVSVPPSVAEAAAAIPDPGLREAFLAVAGRYLGRFPGSSGKP
jgi:hypothetical protein